jgi:hypothetical protein
MSSPPAQVCYKARTRLVDLRDIFFVASDAANSGVGNQP